MIVMKLSKPYIISIFFCFLLCTACKSGTEHRAAFDPDNVKYGELTVNLSLDSGQSAYCCWQDSSRMLFSVGTEQPDVYSGPTNNTDYIAVYDYVQQTIIASYDINSNAYVFSARPYKDGILYVDYGWPSEAPEWELIYIDENGSHIIDSGTATGWEETPQLIAINGEPCYLWSEASTAQEFGLNRIHGLETENVFTESEYNLSGVTIYSNGKQYCFMASKADDEYATFFVGDGSGVIYSHQLDGKIMSFSITGTHAICGLARETEGTDKYFIEALDLRNGEISDIEAESQAWRMGGSMSGMCFFVDSFWNTYCADTEAKTVKPLQLPDYIAERSWAHWARLFLPCEDSGDMVIRFYSNANGEYMERFYLMHC